MVQLIQKNLDTTGKNVKLRRQQEIEKLKRELEEETKKREIAEIEAREARIRQQQMEAAYEREKEYVKEIEKLKNKNNQNEKDKEEERQKKNDKLQSLNNVRNIGSKLAKTGGIEVLGSVGLGLAGLAITPFCPIVGPGFIEFAVGSGAAEAAGVAVGGTMAGVAESKKANL